MRRDDPSDHSKYRNWEMNLDFPLWKGLTVLSAAALGSYYLLRKRSAKETLALEEVDAHLQTRFDLAVQLVQTSHLPFSQTDQLKCYALYKQSTVGVCRCPPPYMWDLVASAKYPYLLPKSPSVYLHRWKAWDALAKLPRAIAMDQYISLVSSCEESDESEKMALTPSVSVMSVDESAPEWQIDPQSVFHLAASGDLEAIDRSLLEGTPVDLRDDEGRTMLHWAVDRDQLSLASLLLSRGAAVDLQDSEGQSALYYAVNCEFEEIALLLVGPHGGED
jgi:acyl-CoA-binding protein